MRGWGIAFMTLASCLLHSCQWPSCSCSDVSDGGSDAVQRRTLHAPTSRYLAAGASNLRAVLALPRFSPFPCKIAVHH